MLVQSLNQKWTMENISKQVKSTLNYSNVFKKKQTKSKIFYPVLNENAE